MLMWVGQCCCDSCGGVFVCDRLSFVRFLSNCFDNGLKRDASVLEALGNHADA
jgi:hypothetical protein